MKVDLFLPWLRWLHIQLHLWMQPSWKENGQWQHLICQVFHSQQGALKLQFNQWSVSIKNTGGKVWIKATQILTEEIASNRAHVQFLGNWNKSIFFEWSLQSGVGNEFSQASVFGNSCLKVPQLLFNFIQRLLFGGSRVECWSIATIQTKNLDWSLLSIKHSITLTIFDRAFKWFTFTNCWEDELVLKLRA